jgi:hypothetical protein
MGKFFTPGFFSLPNLLETSVSGSNMAPKFYGYSDYTGEWVAITAKNQISNYEMIGFRLKTSAIKQVIVLGLDDMPDATELGFLNPEFAEYVWGWYNP